MASVAKTLVQLESTAGLDERLRVLESLLTETHDATP